MARTKRKPYTAADTRRQGGQPLDLLVRRTWVEYAAWLSNGGTADALYAATREPGDVCTVRMSERGTKALVAACEQSGRVNTAEAFRAALTVALKPPETIGPLEHLQMLADLGELDPEELAMLRGAMTKPAENGKELF